MSATAGRSENDQAGHPDRQIFKPMSVLARNWVTCTSFTGPTRKAGEVIREEKTGESL
ncbi:hypothetical protein COMA2_220027 [Candidatus Nitrospira nitrificans]|uniref:Uncharacterized protein n=1 Tax=Candidatus Nitrospira nitrificans TaxID=1742973 RepID=A0A0S4LGE8_9BACT|nr:hypothetical protein COMA2_220027 [Candidatus Nitrospira nitrificans]